MAPLGSAAGEALASAWTAFERVCEERLASFGSQLDAVAGFISYCAERIERIESRVEEVVAKKLLETEARLAGWMDRVVERHVAPADISVPGLAPVLAEVRRIEVMTAKLEGLMSLLDRRPPLPAAPEEERLPCERDAERA